MRWILYGDILERHVVDSFATALREAGHDVTHVPSVARSHFLVTDLDADAEAAGRIDAALPADVLFSFRPSEPIPARIEALRARGVTTVAWFADDPVLYDVCYRHVAPAYDLTLHTGREDLLAFYEERLGVRGYAFPFWTDDRHYPPVYDAARADVELGFLGNFTGQRRRGRYDLLASLPLRVRAFGSLAGEDHGAIHGGVLPPERIAQTLRRFKLGFSAAQTLGEGTGDKYWFPELPRFGTFFFPSRLVAYAGAGVPALSLEPAGEPAPLSAVFPVSSRAELIERARGLLGDEAGLRAASAAARAEFEACLTARSRVTMLEELLTGPRDHAAPARARLWRAGLAVPDRAPPQDAGPPVEVQRARIEVRPVRRSGVVAIGWDVPAFTGLARAAGALVLDAAEVTRNPWELARGDGPVEVRDAALHELTSDTTTVLFADGAAPSAPAAGRLRERGTRLVAVRLADPASAENAGHYAERFDLIVTFDATAARLYESARLGAVLVEPAVDPMLDLGEGAAVHGGTSVEGTAARLALARVLGRDPPPGIELVLPDALAPGLTVLEAIARGSVAVAPRELTLARLEPERELVPYDGVAHAASMVAWLAARPQEADEIRRRAYARVVAEHTWAVRWPRIEALLRPASAARP